MRASPIHCLSGTLVDERWQLIDFGFSVFNFSDFLCLMKTLLALVLSALVALTIVPAARAKISDDQIKTAGAIKLSADLLDKMDKAAKAVSADQAARTELAAVKETELDATVAAINSKCPKAVALFKDAGITAEEIMKATGTILACIMDESGDLAKSDNEIAKANAEFVKANMERCNTVGGEVMAMSMSPDASDPAKKP
jgi:hypothetical protein